MRRLPILLMLTSLLALTTACTETGSLPTAPASPETVSDWSVVYPILVNESLHAAWGLDADDMWAVGDLGTILHYDGERCTLVESPVERGISAIHGRARDDVWAVTSDHVLNWDGHRWRVVREDPDTHNHRTIWCADSGDVFVGGNTRHGNDYLASVLRFDGSRWWDTNLPRLEDERARVIWQPAPGGPVLMATDNGLFRYGNSWWTPTTTQVDIHDVDGALALGRFPGRDATLLFRFGADGEPYAPCPDETLQFGLYGASDVADSRLPLVVGYSAIAAIRDGCELTLLPDQHFRSFSSDLAVPTLQGPTGPVVFATGSRGLFDRGAWNADQTITWQSLVPGPTDALSRSITGSADLVFGSTGRGRLLVREESAWRVETHEEIPSSSRLDMMPDGTLAAWASRFISIRRPAGDWHELPEAPEYSNHLWTDGEAAMIYDNRNREWTLTDGHWTLTDSVSTWIRHLAGRSADEIYRLTGDRVLDRKNGDQWEPVVGDQTIRVQSFYLSPWSDDIYLYLSGSSYGSVTALLRNGVVTVLAEEEGWVWEPDEVCEARPGDFYRISTATIRRLVAGTWQVSTVPGAIYRLTNIWGHPDQGLFVRDYHGRLLHRPFPESAD